MKVIVENLKLSHELNALDGKLRGLHQEIRQVERESNELKKNPEATAGTKSERIAKYIIDFRHVIIKLLFN